MKRLPMWRRYLIFWGRQPEADLEREFLHHLELRTREFIESGVDPETARHEAERRFGDIDSFRAACLTIDRRFENRMAAAETLHQVRNDVGYALRQLRRAPAFTLITVLTLALAIGANASIFSVLHAVVLKPLPYHEPDRLVALWESVPEHFRVAAANYLDWRDKNEVFEDVAIFGAGTANLTGDGEPEELRGLRVSANYFPLLGVKPILGRWIAAEENAPDAAPVVVIDEGLWRRRFGADRAIVGKTTRLSDRVYTIVGVMPEGLYPSWPSAPGRMEFAAEYHRYWAPLAMTPQLRDNRFSHVFGAIARLKPGITLAGAQSAMDALGRALEAAYPRTNKDEGVALTPLTNELVGNVRSGLVILQVSVTLVLLIACANVTSLSVARLSSRRREIAVRSALGAGRFRLVRQFLIEGMLLAAAGGIFGVAGALAALRVLAAVAPPDFPRMDQVQIGAITVLFTTLVCGLACFLFALIPAFHASQPNPLEAMRDSGRSMTAGASRQRVRQLLVVGQVAIAAMLIIASGLLIESFANLKNVAPGFNPVRLLSADLTLPSAKYPSVARISAFADELLQKAQASAGIESAALAYDNPLKATWIDIFSIHKRPTVPGRESPSAYFRIVSPGYFETVGVRLLRGRMFNEFDSASGKGAVIVSEAFAGKFFSGEDPLGEVLDIRSPRSIWGPTVPAEFEIVGIVQDTRFLGLDQPPAPAFYVPFAQCPSGQMTALVRTRTDPDSIVPSLRSLVRTIDPQQPIAAARSLELIVNGELARPRFNMFLMSTFGVVALLLAAVGVYGLLAYLVSQRRQEIGVRVALGASRPEVYRLIVGQGLILAVTGVALGTSGAFVLTRALSKLLFGVSARDPLTFAVSVLVLLVVVIIASSIPAMRATRVNAVVTLRAD
jgi:putative ABC transport system permease protein